jgi:hypothetical protein
VQHRKSVQAYTAKKVAAKRVLGKHAAKHGTKKVKGRVVHTTKAAVKHHAAKPKH